ncbi:hypothetical protein ABT010_28675 [Streptomyces sp. NPDC002668]|uniref:hypothetical protein n=1 Tax=Streptomyces sp. NPDC002668 TaxID=3154422 RepID=UPI003316FF1D
MNIEAVSLVLASAAAVRAFAPDVRSVLRRLLGAGVRVRAATLIEQQRPAPRTDTPGLDEGGSR